MTTPVADPNPTKNYKPDDDDKALQIVAYMFAGLAMMLNIRLSYSAAPYALLRFKLPENLFSVFVRRIASALELWCLPSMLLGNFMDLFQKYYFIHVDTDLQSKATELQDAVGDKPGGSDKKMWHDANELYKKAQTLAGEGGVSSRTDLKGPLEDLKEAVGADDDAFGKLQKVLSELKKVSVPGQDQKSKAIDLINAYTNVKYAFEEVKNLESKYIDALTPGGTGNQQPYNDVESEFSKLQTKYTTAIGNKDPHKWKRWIIKYPSIVTHWLNFLTYVVLWIVYVAGGETGRSGCEVVGTTINSVKLELTSGNGANTHKIILNPGGSGNELTYTTNAITLTGSGTGTLTVNLPAGAITLFTSYLGS
uniref:Uncharacterized protein n=1 Tax=Theileria annulata TaxID=5874 RepID=A0A3B0MV19_THEAN